MEKPRNGGREEDTSTLADESHQRSAAGRNGRSLGEPDSEWKGGVAQKCWGPPPAGAVRGEGSRPMGKTVADAALHNSC